MFQSAIENQDFTRQPMGFSKNNFTSRVIKDLKKRSTFGIVFYLIALVVVLFSNGYHERNPEFSNQFLFLMSITCLFRVLHLYVSSRVSSKYDSINKIIFYVSVTLTGLVWGVGFGKVMIQDFESQTKLLMVMCTIGMCSGGVVAFIPSLKLSIVFSVFMLVPAIIGMTFYQLDLSLMALIVLFLLYMGFMAKRGNKEYWDAMENEHLLEERSKDLKKMSQTDSLTGLHNRRYFDQMFGFEWRTAIRNQTSISAIICDIDHFKKVNDQYGHLAGDAYLEKVAKELKSIFKRETDVVARYGGEEFVIIMPGESQDKVATMAENVRIKIENLTLNFQEQQIRTTISLGIATYVPQPDDRKDVLISRADKALYQSKTSGRNKVIECD